MSKKITDDQGNVYVQKKPFYKKWWVWLLSIVAVLLVVLYLIGSAAEDDADESQTALDSNPSALETTLVDMPVPEEIKDISDSLGEGFKEADDLVVEEMNYTGSVVSGIQMETDSYDDSLTAVLDNDGQVVRYQYNGSNSATLGLLLIAIDSSSKIDLAVSEDMANRSGKFEQGYSTDLYEYSLEYDPENPLFLFTMRVDKK
ncbi:hypothetical protein [Desemzia sp. FAM 23990]|uniref:hypothetical protein n=1 Tax=Desemzia sp. FAM 23990 TaxID=3259520 RepID=UPI0038898D95